MPPLANTPRQQLVFYMPTIVPRAIWIREDGEQARISVCLQLGVEVIREKVGRRHLGFESQGLGVKELGFEI